MSGQMARLRDVILIDHDFLRRAAKASGSRHEMSVFKAYFQQAAKTGGWLEPRFDYFLAWFDDGTDERPAILRYADWLAYNGFKLHFKQFRRHEDVSDEAWDDRRPPDFNVEIAVAALTAARWARRIVIVSDRYALAPALEALRHEGSVIAVASFRDSRNPALIRFADENIDLSAIPGFVRVAQQEEPGGATKNSVD